MSNERHWIAFVIGINNDINKTLASFLSFDAGNRFNALRKIQDTLPEHENWVLSSGQLVEFRVVDLRQCKPSEEEAYIQGYMEAFTRLAGQEPDFEGFYSKPSKP